MMKTNSSWILAVAAAAGLCALAGCNQRESTQETAKDVANARQDANQNVAEERKEAADTAVDNAKDQAAAEKRIEDREYQETPGTQRHVVVCLRRQEQDCIAEWIHDRSSPV